MSKYNLRSNNSKAQTYEEKKISKKRPRELIEEDEEDEEEYKKAPIESEDEISTDEGEDDTSSLSEEEDSGEYEYEYEEEEDEEDERYWKYEKRGLVDAIKSRLRERVQCSEDLLDEAIEAAMEKAQSDIFDSFPTDKDSWKKELDEEEVQRLEPILEDIRKEMEAKRPTMDKILRCKIPRKEKYSAVRLFDLLGNLDRYSEAYFDIEDRIRGILDSEESYKGVDLEALEEEEKRIMGEKPPNSTHLYKTKILSLEASDEVKREILTLLDKMNNLTPADSEYHTYQSKIDYYISLPHRRLATLDIDPLSVRTKLDSRLYGMNDVKERLLEIVNNRSKNPKSKSSVALCGPPGVGKTEIAKTLAECLGVPFDRISLGGMVDSSILKGQHNSWVGASPSIMLEILKKMKYSNGIVLFDEIDKLGAKGQEIQNALLHITDDTQNDEFKDMYLREFSHDLSNIWFMFAMNDSNLLDPVLRDRLSIMKVKAYTDGEKSVIVEKYMLPKILKDVGLSSEDVSIDDTGINEILSNLGNDKGLRSIKSKLERIVSKINMLITSGDTNRFGLSYFFPVAVPVIIDSSVVRKLKGETDSDISESVRRMYL